MERRTTRSQAKAAETTSTDTTTTEPAPPSRSIAPDVAKRIEENRRRAEAIRDQREAKLRDEGKFSEPTTTASPSRKRPLDDPPPALTSNRDGRLTQTTVAEALRPAKKFTRFVDYNMSTMTDTKGGFLSAEDDPTGEAARLQRLAAAKAGASGAALKPKHMSDREWERMQLIQKLQRTRSGPFEPGVSVLQGDENVKKCRECESRAIDWVWEETFGCCVCAPCKQAHPEKYSLLTKTECREDYLLTEPELKDADLLPHLSRPNPHKSHWHDMMLFLRYQVEEYALGPRKWGSAAALDAEFERREADKKKRKDAKFKARLLDLKKKTRTEAFRRQQREREQGEDAVDGGRHVHDWGRTVENAEGLTVKKCLECGMEVEELEF